MARKGPSTIESVSGGSQGTASAVTSAQGTPAKEEETKSTLVVVWQPKLASCKMHDTTTEMPEMTDKQKEALKRLEKRWAKILNVESSIGRAEAVGFSGWKIQPWSSDPAIMVRVQGKSGATMWLGIETDGYTHA